MFSNLVMNTNWQIYLHFLRKKAFNRIVVREALERQTATILGPVKPGSKGSLTNLVYLENCYRKLKCVGGCYVV